MSEVTRPTRPWGSILSAVATVSALALFLIFASAASAASETLTGGTTNLNLTKGFKKKLGKNDVKVLKVGSGKVRHGTVELGVSGGEIDVAAAKGQVQNAGGFKLKSGKRGASITKVKLDVSGSAVFAKVAGSQMKLGSLAHVAVSGQGTAVDVSSGKLKLTGKAAKRLNHKLGIGKVLRGGNAMSNAHSAAQVQAATVVQEPAKEVAPPAPAPTSTDINVMTRNLYLGADLTPAIVAGTPEALFAAAGLILGEVEHNDFPTRAKGLAQEILTEKPDSGRPAGGRPLAHRPAEP